MPIYLIRTMNIPVEIYVDVTMDTFAETLLGSGTHRQKAGAGEATDVASAPCKWPLWNE